MAWTSPADLHDPASVGGDMAGGIQLTVRVGVRDPNFGTAVFEHQDLLNAVDRHGPGMLIAHQTDSLTHLIGI